MNAEQVVNKILSEAHARAGQIVAEAQERADAQMADVKAELADYDTHSERLAQAAAQDKRDRMLAGARMANAKQFLAARVEMIDGVFRKAKEQILAMPDEAYLSLMKSLLQKAVETGDEEVIVGRDERRINEDFIKKVNRELGPGFKGNLRLAAQRGDFAGGFILSRGRIRVNASIDVLVSQVRQTLEPQLVKDLFGKGVPS